MAAALKIPPGPTSSTLGFGSIAKMGAKGLIDFYYDLWREYGDLVQFRTGPINSLMVTRPEHIQHVLVKHPEIYIKGMSHEKLRTAIGNGIFNLEGDPWRRQRKLMQPSYTPLGIRQYADIMTGEATNLVRRWQAMPEGQVLDINVEMVRITMSVISRSIFGVDIGEHHRVFGQALHQLLEYTTRSSFSILDAPLFVPTPKNQRLKRAKQIVREFIFDIIQKRRDEGFQEDLLSMLMNARDEETGETMTDEELHDEILITLFAGHETTATLLTWTWYQLATHPEVEVQLHEELARVLVGRTPSLDDVERLTYTHQVLNETLRLYSPVPIIARDSVEADTLEDFQIPAKALVVIVPYVTHRNPEFWDNPLAFDPAHFSEEQVAARPRYAFYPFGAGQRICIGNHFAMLEAVLLLAEIAQRYQLRLGGTQQWRCQVCRRGAPSLPA